MTLEDLLANTEYELIKGKTNKEITSLVYDSRKAKEGSVFVCMSGSIRDAHDFIPEVIGREASAIVIEKDVDRINGLANLLEMNSTANVTFIKVKNSRRALAEMSAAYFGYPAGDLVTIGVTGTKGKTTTTYMIKDILDKAGIPTGLIGTVEIIIGDEYIHSGNTTPESFMVQNYFRRMVDAGMKAVVMEVSSQALMMNRVEGITFDYGIFTNLEPDHIGENEHKDFEDYMYWKSTLFQKCKTGIFNCDSEYLEGILKGHTCSVETIGISEKADFRAADISFKQEGGKLETRYKVEGKANFDVSLNMPGMFSVYNSLTAIALCKHFNVSDDIIKKTLPEVYVKGRTEIVDVSSRIKGAPNFTVMIDYAHNAMALESLLTTLRVYKPGRLVCLFGCGGNRARSRRFEMGEVSSKLADLTVVTSDNPRFEEPEAIVEDIITGVKKASGEYVKITDRKEAVKYVIKNAKEGDLIVLAGKGHEDYQEIRGVKYHMDERELIDLAVDECNGK
ncbi:MAG: UDP-N-acetylmuramoyl-L-alanyl-D-glutamate--2,6-diaminopimelate ligase [Lachnospiraceae bacterium]|nr:UDP-N-acetylmuramoyl-L-alanyl-D-glutamate--2,6-diaminopimelate ligase [Lachnospiraceae bacterium]